MRRQRHAKIVATLGPASSSPEIIRALFEAGAGRVPFICSHGSHEEHQAYYDIVRAIENETGRPIAVLADLQGAEAAGSADWSTPRSHWTKESVFASTSTPRLACTTASRYPTSVSRRLRPAYICSLTMT